MANAIGHLAAWASRNYPFEKGQWRLGSLAYGLLPEAVVRSQIRTTRTRHGFAMRLDLGQFVDRTIYCTGGWEPLETRVIAAALKPGDSFVDVGANIGFFSLLAHRLVGPTGRVHAIEPTPSTADLLAHNIALSGAGAGAITVHRCAAGDRDGAVTMVVHDAGNIGSNHVSFDGAGAAVPLRRLDQLLSGETIRLIKLDIEGAEAMALRGAGALLDGDTAPALLFEFSPDMLRGMGDDPAVLLHDLEAKGYIIYEIHPDRLTPRDDAILDRAQTYLLALKPGDGLLAALGG
ncbi:FkbM family methyltransferase [Sphingopyxis sp.]|jgi:FkbM family methyltransferase|uniref:FkbM family methyltransferase n=1 Tax=Sphingopyxis sp. TaxID=1908224 RepID=UPI003F6F574A